MAALLGRAGGDPYSWPCEVDPSGESEAALPGREGSDSNPMSLQVGPSDESSVTGLPLAGRESVTARADKPLSPVGSESTLALLEEFHLSGRLAFKLNK